jgi:hypothetical protein
MSSGGPPAGDQGASAAVKERAREGAEQAKEITKDAVGRAGSGLRDQVGQRSTQAGERITATAGDLRSVGSSLREQGKDGPARLADSAAERAERLGGYLQRSDPDRLLHDMEDFGRRQPWTVVAAGVALGFVAARVLKASSADRYRSRTAGEIAANGFNGAPSGVGSGAAARPAGAPSTPPGGYEPAAGR